MKSTTYLLLLLLIISTIPVFSQSKVYGSNVAERAKAGEDIIVENAHIKGVVNLTNSDSEDRDEGWFAKFWSGKWWGSTNVDEKMINGKLVFKNCTFEDDFIAYINVDNNNTFTASFKNSVTFINCTFKGAAAFKYSKFQKDASFLNSVFHREANFKYAKFDKESEFTGCNFNGSGNFKYAKFDRIGYFQSAEFKRDANFKYAKLYEGIDLRGTKVGSELNIKYAKMGSETQTAGLKVKGGIDAKYTKVDGKSWDTFTSRYN